MLISATCPSCGRIGDIPEKSQGKRVSCRGCGNSFIVPQVPIGIPAGPVVKSISSPPPIRRRPQAEQVQEENGNEFNWQGVSEQQPELEPEPVDPDYEPSAYRAPKPAREENPSLGQILGTASLIVDVLGGLFLFLPCFWFLALPISALGLMLGFAGVFRRSGRPLSIAGLILGAVLTFISGVLILWAQAQLGIALDRLKTL